MLLSVLVLSQVFFVSTSYSKAEDLGLIDKSKHEGISCIRHRLRDCFVYYQTGVCLVEIKYYSNKNSQQPDYTEVKEVNTRVESGVNVNTPDVLADGLTRRISRNATLNDFNEQKNKLNQYLSSGDSSNDKLPQCGN